MSQIMVKPFADHAPATLRMLWATCANDPASQLTATQRAAIRTSLADWQWAPDPAALPETAAVVESWYAMLGPGQAPIRPKRAALSVEARRARQPLPPASLVGALQDHPHKDGGIVRVPRVARSKK